MRSSKINYIIVGVFVLAMLAGIVVSVALLTGRTGATDDYFTTYTDATGLKFGTAVLYMGYPVGQVEEIEPDVGENGVRFRVRMSISEQFRDWGVPRDSIAEIKSAGLLAALTIDIRTGKAAEVLIPGDVLEGVERRDVFGAVADTANTIRRLTIEDVKPLIANLRHSMDVMGTAIEKDGAPLLANLNRFAGHLADRGPEIVSNVLATSTEIRKASEGLQKILTDDNAGKVGTFVDNLTEASDNILALTVDARTQLDALIGPKVTDRVDQVVDNVLVMTGDARASIGEVLGEENRAHVRNTLSNLENASVDVHSITGQVEEATPQAIANVEAILVDLEVAVSDARTAGQRIKNLLSEENTARIDRIIASIANASSEVEALLDEDLRKRVDLVVDNLVVASADVLAVTASARERVGEFLSEENAARVQSILGNLDAASANAKSLSADVKERLARALSDENLQQVDQIVDDVNAASSLLAELVTDVKRQLNNLLGPRTADRVDETLGNVSLAAAAFAELSVDLKANLGRVLTPETIEQVRGALSSFSLAANNVSRLSSQLIQTREHLDKLLLNLDGVVVENRPDLRQSISNLRFTLQTVSQHIGAFSQNLESTSRNMAEFSRQLRQNPGVLLRGTEPGDETAPVQ